MRRDGGDVSEAEPNWSELETAMRIRGFWMQCTNLFYVSRGVGGCRVRQEHRGADHTEH